MGRLKPPLLSKEELIDSLNIMCRRCINHKECMGTGCTPRNTLLDLIDRFEGVRK